jgi:hypothetical protein
MMQRAAPAGAPGAAGSSALRRGQWLCADETHWRIRTGQLTVAVTVLALAAGPHAFNLLPLCPDPVVTSGEHGRRSLPESQ